MVKSAGKRINARIPDGLAKQLDEYDEINQSAVIRQALQREVNIRQKLRQNMDSVMRYNYG